MNKIPITSITIERYLDEDGEDVVTVECQPEGVTPIEVTGILQLAMHVILENRDR